MDPINTLLPEQTTTSTPPPGESKNRNFNLFAAFFVIVIVLITIIELSISFIESQKKSPKFESTSSTRSTEESIQLEVQVYSFDPQKGELNLRITPHPSKELLDTYDNFKKEITIETNNSTGDSTFEFDVGKKTRVLTTSIHAEEDKLREYPLDEYSFPFYIYIRDKGKDAAIPADISVRSNLSDFQITQRDIQHQPDYFTMRLFVERNITTKSFSGFILVSIWLLISMMIWIILSIVLDRRKVEMVMCTMFSSLLFALPALRNSQPGVPPIGAIIDYFGFFWAQFLAAVGLITLTLIWVFRKEKK